MKTVTAAKPTRAATGLFPGESLMMRYSLAALLIAVVVVSVGCAAITHPTPLWSQIVFTATIVVLLGATVAAIVGRPRPFAAGLAIFGWGYLFLTNGPWAHLVRPHLLTETALAKVEPLVSDPNATAGGLGGYGGGWGGSGSTLWVGPSGPYGGLATTYTTLPYALVGSDGNPWLRQIGHTLWAILFGAVGGGVARFAAAHKEQQHASSAPAPA
jgi:hypothetical protein